MKAELKIYTAQQVLQLVKKRTGETRLGEIVQTLNPGENTLEEKLKDCTAKYVLLGIPEDIGVRANLGRGGAYSAWQPALSTLMNVQSNHFLRGDDLLVLGAIDCDTVMERMTCLDNHQIEQLSESRKLVEVIDTAVWPVVKAVMDAGKELIVIGGGHNNAFPILKGMSESFHQKVNCINCDAHADLRPLEGRHSGNGFSYALAEGYLNKYAMVGLQEIFNTATVLERIKNNPHHLHAVTYESVFIQESFSWKEAVKDCLEFIIGTPCGLELDIDIIQNIPSSAKTSSGITTIQARQYVHEAALSADTRYFHIAEAAPVLSHIKTDLKTGKLIAYLVTDYIKARNSRKN